MTTRSELTIDLTTAAGDVPYTLRADWYHVDPGTTGVAIARHDTLSDPAITLTGGASFNDAITDIFVSWESQPGRFVRIFYGDGVNPFTAGPAAPVYAPGAIGQKSYSAVAAGTVIIVSAAVNVRGIVIRQVFAAIYNGAIGDTIFLWDGANIYTRFLNLFAATAGYTATDRIQNWIIPPGTPLTVSASGSTTWLNLRYDIL